MRIKVNIYLEKKENKNQKYTVGYFVACCDYLFIAFNNGEFWNMRAAAESNSRV